MVDTTSDAATPLAYAARDANLFVMKLLLNEKVKRDGQHRDE